MKKNMREYSMPIERLHLLSGYLLIVSGAFAYFTEGMAMFLGWAIFGCMYISMSDIGEVGKSIQEQKSLVHKNRRFTAYFGALFSIVLFGYYFLQVI